MICIIKRDACDKIVGWLIAMDTYDARRQAESAGDRALASALYRMDTVCVSQLDLAIPGIYRYTLLRDS
jgi:hypothetical protein